MVLIIQLAESLIVIKNTYLSSYTVMVQFHYVSLMCWHINLCFYNGTNYLLPDEKPS